jgi:hypothetical protein
VADDLDRRSSDADVSAPAGRTPGVREAVAVGGIAVVVVLAAAVITFLLPPDARDLVFRTPLLILVLIGGTAAVLWTITRPRRIDP